jgi:hypothetical protein
LSIALCAAETWNFDSAAPGSLPRGWSSAMTHTGGPPKWQVMQDATAPSKPNVLAQLSTDSTAGRFPLAIFDTSAFQNGAVSVKFKAVSGRVDRAGGLVWRYRDENNYYIVRANALENNVVLYKVQGGTRTSLPPKGLPSKSYGVKYNVPSGVWNMLRVSVQGALFTVFLNGEKLFQVEDSTFPGPGKAGVWTKADSVTYFDDFSVEMI